MKLTRGEVTDALAHYLRCIERELDRPLTHEETAAAVVQALFGTPQSKMYVGGL